PGGRAGPRRRQARVHLPRHRLLPARVHPRGAATGLRDRVGHRPRPAQLPAQGARHPGIRRSRPGRRAPDRRPGQTRRAVPRGHRRHPSPAAAPADPGRTTRMTTTTVTKRAATGALTGLALGDALGFPTEFNDVPSILAKCGPWREMDLPRPAVVTDDTQMTLALGNGLRTAMDRVPLTPRRLERPVREEFVEWWRSPE